MLSLPIEVEEIRKKARKFALENFKDDIAMKYDTEEKFPFELWKKAFSEGLINFSNPWVMLVTLEEFCRVDPSLGIATLIPTFGSEILMLFGNDEQKKKYLEPVLKGERISGVAITEPVAGSDVAGIQTKLEKDQSGNWILNGQKIFISNGTIADHLYVLARSSQPPSFEKRHHGLTLVIVEKKMKGFSSSQLKGKLGVRATNTAELRFENVVIPPENIIGEIGKGFYYIMVFFNISRVYVATQAIGLAQGVLDELLDYLVTAKKESNPIADYESSLFLLAEIATRIEAARSLTYKAADLVFKFTPDPILTSMAKYYASEVANFAAEKSLEFIGNDAMISKLERFYRDAKIMEIWEGATEIEKLVISRMLIKNRMEKNEQ
jgi:Acyl-CoA dehydrogenases